MKTHIAVAAAALFAWFAGSPAGADQATEDCLNPPCPNVATAPTETTVGNACGPKRESDVTLPKQNSVSAADVEASAVDVEGRPPAAIRKTSRDIPERQTASWVLACRVVHNRAHKGVPQSCTDFGAHAFFRTPVECLTASKKFREMVADHYGWTAIAFCYRTR